MEISLRAKEVRLAENLNTHDQHAAKHAAQAAERRAMIQASQRWEVAALPRKAEEAAAKRMAEEEAAGLRKEAATMRAEQARLEGEVTRANEECKLLQQQAAEAVAEHRELRYKVEAISASSHASLVS